MAELTIELVYGSALLEVAKETDKVELIKEEAAELVEIFERERDLHTFVSAPGISDIEKREVLSNIFEGQICGELLNFLYILVDKGRMLHFTKIIKEFNRLEENAEEFSHGTVYSVVPLGDSRVGELEAETSKLLRANVKLTNEIDPNLIGGFKIFVEGKLIDASIRKKFDELSSQMNLH